MCGIAGAINWGSLESLTAMIDLQAHRGPDDQGLWQGRRADGGWVGLGARRLAILDRSPNGHMPMTTPDGNFTIVYNGEIFNYPALRVELEQKGYRFRSGSDTEAILYLYAEDGPGCVRRLNGMFALAIWDKPRQQLFLARDPFGIKPLYYSQRGARFAFASEAKALLSLPDVARTVNMIALRQYLTFLWVPDPLTIFEGIAKIPPGHHATYRADALELTRYWDLEFPSARAPFENDETELANELRDRLLASIRAQMLSDVPVAAFLSAGIDSSSIVAGMAQASSHPVRTFTIGFPRASRLGETTLDDTEVARQTAAHFGCQHTEIQAEPDAASLLPKLVWHMDEPTADPAIIMAYLINREASQDVTVLLSGVGGDELFAGYRKYRAHELANHYRRIPGVLRRELIEPAAAALPDLSRTRFKGHVRLLKKMFRSASLPPVARFIRDSIYLTPEQQANLLVVPPDGAVWLPHEDAFRRMAHADFLNQMLYVDMKTFMVSLNLNYNDKMSMASSTEVRVPFLERELVEWVASNVSPRLKLRGRTTKYLLREAMRPLLPATVLRQPKAGFGAPIDYWLRHDLAPMVDDLLSEQGLRQRGLFDAGAVRQMICQQRTGRVDWSLQIWQLLTLEIWFRTFIDGGPAMPVGMT